MLNTFYAFRKGEGQGRRGVEDREGKFANFGLSQSTAKRNQGQAKASVSSSSSTSKSTSRPFLLTLPGGPARVLGRCSLHDVWQRVPRCVLETHVVRANTPCVGLCNPFARQRSKRRRCRRRQCKRSNSSISRREE